MGKKVLMITNRVPELHAKGDQIASYRKIEALNKNKFEVVVLCITHKVDSRTHLAVDDLVKAGNRVLLYKISSIASVFSIIKNSIIFGRLPLQVSMYFDNKSNEFIKKLVDNIKPDLILGITSRTAESIRVNKSVPFAIDFIDSLALNFFRSASLAQWPMSLLFKHESMRMKKYETKVAKLADLSWVVSRIDKDYLGVDSINVLPVPTDLYDSEECSKKFERNGNVIAFTGNMNYQPNIESIKWFLNSCWGVVKSKRNDVVLKIAGRNISRKLKEYVSTYESVVVIGEVESMHDFLSQVDIAIAPMVSGSGMQLKILEAMSARVPVITNQVGYGDLSAVVGQDIFVENDPEKFAESIMCLLNHRNIREAVADNGYLYVKSFHSPEIISQKFICQVEKYFKFYEEPDFKKKIC